MSDQRGSASDVTGQQGTTRLEEREGSPAPQPGPSGDANTQASPEADSPESPDLDLRAAMWRWIGEGQIFTIDGSLELGVAASETSSFASDRNAASAIEDSLTAFLRETQFPGYERDQRESSSSAITNEGNASDEANGTNNPSTIGSSPSVLNSLLIHATRSARRRALQTSQPMSSASNADIRARAIADAQRVAKSVDQPDATSRKSTVRSRNDARCGETETFETNGSVASFELR